MTRSLLRIIVFGLMIILVDFRIGTFDVVNDSIGYILIYNGIKSMTNIRWFRYAKVSTIILAIFSLIELFGWNHIQLNGAYGEMKLFAVFGGLISLISLFNNLNIMAGFIQLLQDEGIVGADRKLASFRKVYFVINALIILLLPFSMFFADWYLSILPLPFLIGFIVEVMLIYRINSLKAYYST
ncbi:hypothetical protein JOC86_002887 [Bacillus pakistanensis]|uniref:Integral membrane protein n=1 Tax=Rossellomorea pakistanensis TaxID=992288 RepID=A0ABS2NEP8_9BACI|nr:hypothetical protein [Bacillus pakistanensis]MBM7586335.1 hypothetical protein [Bacillus pakistanensis]